MKISLDFIRFWLHFPVGVVAGVLCVLSPPLGITFTGLFCFYELMNDWRKKDWSYKDVYGFIWGWAVPVIIYGVLLLVNTLDLVYMSG